MPLKALLGLVFFVVCCPILGYGLGVLQGGRAFTSRFRWALPVYFAVAIPCLLLYQQNRTRWLGYVVMIGGVLFGLAMSRIGRALAARDSAD